MSAAEKLAPKVQNDSEIPVKLVVLDASRPHTLPGALSSTIQVGKKGAMGVTYQSITHVVRRRCYRIDCLQNGKIDSHWIPEHMVIDLKYEE